MSDQQSFESQLYAHYEKCIMAMQKAGIDDVFATNTILPESEHLAFILACYLGVYECDGEIGAYESIRDHLNLVCKAFDRAGAPVYIRLNHLIRDNWPSDEDDDFDPLCDQIEAFHSKCHPAEHSIEELICTNLLTAEQRSN